MKCLFILLSLFSGTLSVLSQERWGYSVASLKMQTDEEFIDLVFISNIKRLSSLNCKEDAATSLLPEDDRYSKCISDWFHEKIAHVNRKAYELLNKNSMMMGDIELYNNPPPFLRQRLQYQEFPISELPTIYLTKKAALKKRNEFLSLAEQNNCLIVEVD